MKRSKFTEKQIAFDLNEKPVHVSTRSVGSLMPHRQTSSTGKIIGDTGVAELRCLHQLQEENAQLKKLVADLSLDKQMQHDVIKKAVRPREKNANW